MGLVKSNFNPELLSLQLANKGETTNRKILAVMRDEAGNIVLAAQQNAPFKDGDLEKAIQAAEDRGGINGRTQISIRVDPSAVDEHGVQVAEYAAIMHSGLAPYGTGAFELDTKSLEKDAGSGKVGGRFLERAMNSRIGELGKKVKAIITEGSQ
jgi:hypothetical protein